MPTISDTLTVTSEPSGAQVYLKRFSPDALGKFPPRALVGTTPINNLRIARGQYILYLEKDGYAKTERTVSGAILHALSFTVVPPPIRVEQKLIAADKMPERMAFVPGLMMHGRYDEIFSLETETEPLYKLLREPKRLVLYDGGHMPPFEFMVTTMNSWFDESLGPVKRE